MKKIALYVSLAITGLFTAACSEDFKDWANPLFYAQEDAITIPGFTASAVGSIDLNTADDNVKVLSLSSSTLPEGSEVDNVRFITEDNQTINATGADGTFAKDDLQNLVVGLFGPRPDARSLNVHVYADVMKDGQAAYVDAGSVELNITPEAPVIEKAYYYVGATNGWSDSDQTYKFDNGGGDVYENPVFTVTVPAPYNEDGTRADNWFKIAPESAYTSGDFWSNLWGVAVDGDTSTEGSLVFNANALNQPGSDGAIMYRISINMLEQTYSITPLSFNEYLYEAGVNNDWGAIEQPLYSPANDGLYTGFFYAQDADWSGGMGAFKFTGAFNDWSQGNYGTGTINSDGLSGTLIDDGGSGNVLATPGFYRADVNLATMTYTLTPINSIFVVGSAVNNDWDKGVEMTYNIAERCWECTTTLNEGQIKFKGNGTWDNLDGNWGGTLDNVINGSNDNIDTPVTGKVTIKFYPRCDTKSYATITAAN